MPQQQLRIRQTYVSTSTSNLDRFLSLEIGHCLKTNFQNWKLSSIVTILFSKYYTSRWTHFSSIGSILISIPTIIAGIEHSYSAICLSDFNWSIMSRLPLHRATKHGSYEVAIELRTKNSNLSVVLVDVRNSFGK